MAQQHRCLDQHGQQRQHLMHHAKFFSSHPAHHLVRQAKQAEQLFLFSLSRETKWRTKSTTSSLWWDSCKMSMCGQMVHNGLPNDGACSLWVLPMTKIDVQQCHKQQVEQLNVCHQHPVESLLQFLLLASPPEDHICVTNACHWCSLGVNGPFSSPTIGDTCVECHNHEPHNPLKKDRYLSVLHMLASTENPQ